MRKELIAKTRSLAGTSDLTLLAPIRPGLVPSLQTMTYNTRVRRVLDALSIGRSSSHEYELLRPFSDAVERVGMIHSVRVIVVEPENKILLAASFDGNWESYIRVLWQKVGTLLDLIFCSSIDYVTAHDNRFEDWLAWAQRVQIESHFYYGRPYLTVGDVRYLRGQQELHVTAPGHADTDLQATRQTIESVETAAWQATRSSGQSSLEAFNQGLQGLAAIYRLTDVFLPRTDDGWILQRAANELLREFTLMMERGAFPADALALASIRFKRQLEWLQSPSPDPRARAKFAPTLPELSPPEYDINDVQGGIVRAYKKVSHGCLMLLHFDNTKAAGHYLDRLLPHVTSDARRSAVGDDRAVNVAVTVEGLRMLGLSEAELAYFPLEFRQGMEARCSTLGDVRTNHPRRWRLPERNWPAAASGEPQRVELSAVHLVVQVLGGSALNDNCIEVSDPNHPLHKFVEELALLGGRAVHVLAVQAMRRYQDAKGNFQEHFGFVDGGSQPTIDPARKGRVYRNQVHLGELLLGYANGADAAPDPAKSKDPESALARLELLRNGSFLVIRKLSQDVPGLLAVVADEAGKANISPAALMAKLMGRDQKGEPLTAVPPVDGADGNDFDFSADAEGKVCPFHAHIRRANPRQLPGQDPKGGRPPRIARRGLSYGPRFDLKDPGSAAQARGLVFLAYNASISEQFEVIQRWIAGGNSSGGYSGQSDPFVGVPENGSRRRFRFETDSAAGPVVRSVALDGSDQRLGDRAPFTQLEWGAYCFTPSLTALRRLSTIALDRPVETVWSADDGSRRITALRELERTAGPDAAALAWKEALEDPYAREHFVSAGIWAAVRRDHGGVLKTPYGILAANRHWVDQVLQDATGAYSVDGYARRMQGSLGEIYLGLDDTGPGCPYRQQSKVPNDKVLSMKYADVLQQTHDVTAALLRDFLDFARLLPSAADPRTWELILDASELVDAVLAKLCQYWFGLPTSGGRLEAGSARMDWAAGDLPLYPGNFTAPSRYIFQPNPGDTVQQVGSLYGRTLTAALELFVADCRARGEIPKDPKGDPAPLAEAIFSMSNDNAAVARTMVGVLMGFLPTAGGSLLSVLNQWLQDGTLWSCRARIGDAPAGATVPELARLVELELRQTMQLRPSPELVWRTATRVHTLGGVEVGLDDKVVVSLVSATHECLENDDPDVSRIFGGLRGNEIHPTHACPAYDAARGLLDGFAVALLSVREDMRPSPVSLVLTFTGPFDAEAKPAPKGAVETWKAAVDRAEKQSAADNLRKVQELRHQLARPPAESPPGDKGRPPAKIEDAPDVVLGIGDSWFDYFAMDVFQVFQEDQKLGLGQSRSFARAGTSLVELESTDQLLQLDEALASMAADGKRPRAILLSAGGDDVIKESLEKLVVPRADRNDTNRGLITKDMATLVDETLQVALTRVLDTVGAMCRVRCGAPVPILIHGYAYPFPDGRGPLGSVWDAWLQPAFRNRGYGFDTRLDLALCHDTMTALIEALNEMQIRVAKTFSPHVVHVDLTKVLTADLDHYPDLWSNELHPTGSGFSTIAASLAAMVPPFAVRPAGP